MVALGILPNDEDFHQLKSRMEMLEFGNAYFLEVVTWMTCRHWGVFHPPAAGPTKGVSSATVNFPTDLEPQVLNVPGNYAPLMFL